MSRNTKIGLAIVAAIIVMGICACVGAVLLMGRGLSQVVVTDPQKIEELRQQLVDYDLPEGFSESGMNFMTVQGIIMMNISADPQTIFLFGMPTTSGDVTQEEIDQAVKQAGQSDSSVDWKTVDTTPVEIMGQTVELTTQEGESSGTLHRRQQCAFTGRKGVVILMFIGTASGWDQEMVDTFIASIR